MNFNIISARVNIIYIFYLDNFFLSINMYVFSSRVSSLSLWNFGGAPVS